MTQEDRRVLRIESRDNPRIRMLRNLLESARDRRQSGQTVLEGIHLCQTFLTADPPGLQWVVSDAGWAHPEVQALLQADTRLRPVLQIPDRLMASLGTVESAVPVMAQIPIPTPPLPEVIDTDCVILDRLQDPGNAGTVLRACAASGVRRVLACAGTTALWSPKVLRSGMGAHAVLELIEGVSLDAVLDRLRMPLMLTSSHADRSLYDIDLRAPVAWVLGHEGGGVDAAWSQSPQVCRVGIPQPGPVESLNVAMAASICLFEQVRQRQTR